MKNLFLPFLIIIAYNGFSQKGPVNSYKWNPNNETKHTITVSEKQFNVQIQSEIAIIINAISFNINRNDIIQFKILNQDLVETTFPNNQKDSIDIIHGSISISDSSENKKLTINLLGTLKNPLGKDSDSNPDIDDAVLKGVKYFVDDQFSKDTPNYYCNKMEKCNAILVLDGSKGISAQSKLYRKKSNGKCTEDDCWFGCRQTLKVGDYLKVYIENFNANLYDIEFISKQTDFQYGKNEPLVPIKSSSKDETEAVKDSTNSEKILQEIDKYAKATNKLKQFLAFIRNNQFPDSKLLNENKTRIYHNIIDTLELDPNIDFDALYNLLSEDDQKKEENKKLITNAKQFGFTFYELMNLSYTYEIAGLTIQNKSYDQLSLTIKLKDKKSGNVVREQEYIYLIRGGLKVDQSFGIGLHNIKDTHFTLREGMRKDTTFAMQSNGETIKIKMDDGTIRDSISSIRQVPIQTIEKGDTSNYRNLGLTTLTHFYYRLTGPFTIGPEIGVNVDFYPSTNIRYLLGLGVLFMDGRNRISLDVGMALGKYADLGNGIKSGDSIDGANTSPSTVEKFGRSWYFGISYNIPLSKENIQKEER